MYICLCLGVTSTIVEQAIHEGARSTKQVAASCGAGSVCGRCRHNVGTCSMPRHRIGTTAGVIGCVVCGREPEQSGRNVRTPVDHMNGRDLAAAEVG